jgi:type VI secretion system protein ImpA
MPTPPIIDIESLLQPIPGEMPCGPDLRADASPGSAYYRVKDARTAARVAERADISGEATAPAEEWRVVIDEAPKLIGINSKDLEIAAWYAEALLRYAGFAGLRDGLELIACLVDRFWDGIYPLPDEDGAETTVGPIAGLNGSGGEGTLIIAIQRAPLIRSATRPLPFWRLEQAIEFAKITDEERRARRLEEGAATMDEVAEAVRSTSLNELLGLVGDVAEAREALLRLDAALGARLGAYGPPLGSIRDLLQRVEDMLRYVGRDRLAGAVSSIERTEENGLASKEALETEGGGWAPTNGNYSREQALRHLAEIADFFRRTEPHSPLSYTLAEVVRRANLSMQELLDELLPDSSARNHFLLAAGIKPPSE